MSGQARPTVPGGLAVAAAGLAAVLIAGLIAACGPRAATGSSATAGAPSQASSASAPTGGVVPWVDRPAVPYAEPKVPSHPADARPCAAADLSASPGQGGVGLGNTNQPIDLTNRSATPCLLAGYPTLVAGISADGSVIPLAATRGSYFGDPGPAANIAPGQTAAVNISSSDACQQLGSGRHRIYPLLRIGLPGGGFVDTTANQFDTICGLSVSQFGVPAYSQGNIPQPLPITATIAAPATVSPGEEFTFTVTLANPADRAYSLRPCPVYEMYIYALPSIGQPRSSADFVDRNYYLNCDTVHEIGAHGSVTYQMRLRLPAGLPVGAPAKFVWRLQGDAGPSAFAPLRTTA